MLTIGLDLGKKHIGVAISDLDGKIAVPYSVLDLVGDAKTDTEKVVSLVLELGAEALVVGLPLSLNGQSGTAAQLAKKFVKAIEEKLDISVNLHDERFSTVEANKKLKDAGMSSRQSRSKVDMVAATIILQSWLDKQDYQQS